MATGFSQVGEAKWRLGLDLGTNSLGWAALSLSKGSPARPDGLLDLGVRIYSDARDPQSKESNAATRRGPRGARRNRERYLLRRAGFLRALIETGLLPADQAERHALEKSDPWILRARALSEPLTLHEVGRALFHLQQRRGFKSNRLTDKGSDEKGAVESGAETAREEMNECGAETLGELKGRPRQSIQEENRELPQGVRKPMPLARVRAESEGSKLAYSYYPLRSMIEVEFDAIWDAQARHHPDAMTDTARSSLWELLSFQRPLKPQPVGRCTFESEEERAPSALPSMQRLRIYQELNNLRVSRSSGEPQLPLKPDERDKLTVVALSKPKLSLTQMRKTLGLSSTATFSIEAGGRDFLDGDKTHDIITANRKSNSGSWAGWADLSPDEQEALAEILLGRVAPDKGSHPAVVETHQKVVARIAKGLGLTEGQARQLLEAKEDEALVAFLSERYGLEWSGAERIVSLRLPDGHGRLSRTAGAKVLAQLEAPDENGELRTYDRAVVAAGYFHHSLRGTGEVFDHLPYYGVVLEQSVAFGTGDPDDIEEKRIGKLANPTVHVALNQLRKVVNALIERYGPPAEIVVELSRDLPLGAVEKNKLEKRQRDNRQENEKRAERLAEFGVANNYNNRLFLRLWDELDALGRKCPFSGEHLSQDLLVRSMSGSGELEIEHILPFSRTLDDSFNNKALALREANRRKGSLSPWEAVERGIFDRETIERSLRDFPPAKAWRFGPDAMDRFENEERDFLDRQLNDNKYISRLAAQYLKSLGSKVWVINGRLTADLRHHWGLNAVLTGHNRAPADSEAEGVKKNRNDHRHHPVDAFVIGCTDPWMVQQAASEAKKVEEEFAAGQRDHRRLLAGIPDPFADYLLAVKEAVGRIVVSHKPDHGIQGKLHEDTNYGVVRTQAGETRLATRKSIAGLTPGEIKNIGDDRIRRELVALTEGLGDKERKQALIEYSERTGHKRVRVHKVQASFERIEHGPDSKGKRHVRAVIPGDNHCMDIVETSDGKWHGVAVTRFQAHKSGWQRNWRKVHPDALLVMRVRNGDLIRLENEGMERVMRVVRLNPSGNRIYLAAANEAGDYQRRHDDPDDDFRWDLAGIGGLKSRKARLVRVTPDGQLIDPGLPS